MDADDSASEKREDTDDGIKEKKAELTWMRRRTPRPARMGRLLS
jgi:hypothetical protein